MENKKNGLPVGLVAIRLISLLASLTEDAFTQVSDTSYPKTTSLHLSSFCSMTGCRQVSGQMQNPPDPITACGNVLAVLSCIIAC